MRIQTFEVKVYRHVLDLGHLRWLFGLVVLSCCSRRKLRCIPTWPGPCLETLNVEFSLIAPARLKSLVSTRGFLEISNMASHHKMNIPFSIVSKRQKRYQKNRKPVCVCVVPSLRTQLPCDPGYKTNKRTWVSSLPSKSNGFGWNVNCGPLPFCCEERFVDG